MKRLEWKFEYPAHKVLGAVEEKVAYHAGRVEWWTNKRNEAFAKLKEEGVEINESIVERESKLGYSNSARSFGNRAGVSVELNQEIVEDIEECTRKIAEHKAHVKEYTAWRDVLRDQSDARVLELNHDDWLYFFGK